MKTPQIRVFFKFQLLQMYIFTNGIGLKRFSISCTNYANIAHNTNRSQIWRKSIKNSFFDPEKYQLSSRFQIIPECRYCHLINGIFSSNYQKIFCSLTFQSRGFQTMARGPQQTRQCLQSGPQQLMVNDLLGQLGEA